MAWPLAYVVLLNWNGWRDTLACIESLERLSYPNYKVVVVDNGSTDDSVERIRKACPSVPVIESGGNLGFASGCNVGIRHALSRGADYVWLLNNDTVVDASALAAMVERAERDEGVGAVGSLIHYMDHPERVQAWAGGYINFWLGRSRLYTMPTEESALDFISGASILIRREALQSVGFLDEDFFMSWEETDFCFRLRSAGWKLAAAPASLVYHKGSASFLGRSHVLDAYFTQSARRFFRKHGRFPTLSLWTGVSLSMLKRILLGRWRSVFAVWPSRCCGLGGRGERA